MEKSKRLLVLVKHLESAGGIWPERMAELLGTSRRTIYRDLQTLRDMQVPVKRAGGRYYLEPGQWARWTPRSVRKTRG